MYNISCKQKYQSYLNIDSIEKRLSNLICSNKKNIIYLKDIFDNSTFRYRTYNMMQAMEESSKYHVNCFLIEEIDFLIQNLNKISCVILQRCKWSFKLESFIYLLKQNRIKIIYDMDDLIYDPKYVPNYLNSTGYYDEIHIDVHFAIAARYKMIAEICDAFLVTTEGLKKKMELDFKKEVFVYQNFLNKEQEEISNEIVLIKDDNKDDSKFVIGYFSGSNSHVRDLETVESALLQLMNKYDNIYLNIVGYMDLSDNLKKLKTEGRVIISPFVTYQELEYLIASVDINIIPLQKNEFNECKSELKYFEASIVNTVSVACNNSVYSKIINNSENGFLADEAEWFERLEYIYLNPEKIKKIVKKAREDCILKYSCYNQIDKLEKLYDRMLEM